MPMPPNVPSPDTVEPMEVTYERLLLDNPTIDHQARRYYSSVAAVCVFAYLLD